jgi:hypothetical protein
LTSLPCLAARRNVVWVSPSSAHCYQALGHVPRWHHAVAVIARLPVSTPAHGRRPQLPGTAVLYEDMHRLAPSPCMRSAPLPHERGFCHQRWSYRSHRLRDAPSPRRGYHCADSVSLSRSHHAKLRRPPFVLYRRTTVAKISMVVRRPHRAELHVQLAAVGVKNSAATKVRRGGSRSEVPQLPPGSAPLETWIAATAAHTRAAPTGYTSIAASAGQHVDSSARSTESPSKRFHRRTGIAAHRLARRLLGFVHLTFRSYGQADPPSRRLADSLGGRGANNRVRTRGYLPPMELMNDFKIRRQDRQPRVKDQSQCRAAR